MTAAQQKSRERFKKAIAEAKKLRKKNPKLSQAQAVKQAWAILYSSGKVSGVKKKAAKKAAVSKHKDTKSHNVNIKVVSGVKKVSGYVATMRKGNKTNVLYTRLSGFFDTSVIKDLDGLKKTYLKLAKKYHPDAGGTTVQFQDLQNEYERLLNNLLNGSSLSDEAKKNEKIIDKEIRLVIDQLINLESINVELIGKWLWISGNTYPVKETLKKAGLIFIKKAGEPFWVYKGIESKGRGDLTLEEIKKKYGSTKIDIPQTKKISGINVNKTKLYSALIKLKSALNKRPI